MPDRSYTRRTFVARAAAVGAVIALPACGGKANLLSSAGTAFVLDTGCGEGACACTACAKHAANKLFATRDAADGGRAHPHCDCTVTETTIPRSQWDQLFADATTVDRRNPRVAEILKA